MWLSIPKDWASRYLMTCAGEIPQNATLATSQTIQFSPWGCISSSLEVQCKTHQQSVLSQHLAMESMRDMRLHCSYEMLAVDKATGQFEEDDADVVVAPETPLAADKIIALAIELAESGFLRPGVCDQKGSRLQSVASV